MQGRYKGKQQRSRVTPPSKHFNFLSWLGGGEGKKLKQSDVKILNKQKKKEIVVKIFLIFFFIFMTQTNSATKS